MNNGAKDKGTLIKKEKGGKVMKGKYYASVSVLGEAKDSLLEAWSKGRVLELLKEVGLPHRTFAFGDSAIAVEVEDDRIEYVRGVRRRIPTGRVIIHIKKDLTVLEILNAEIPVLKTNMNEYYSGAELSQRYVYQQIKDSDRVFEQALRDIILPRIKKIVTNGKFYNKFITFIPEIQRNEYSEVHIVSDTAVRLNKNAEPPFEPDEVLD